MYPEKEAKKIASKKWSKSDQLKKKGQLQKQKWR